MKRVLLLALLCLLSACASTPDPTSALGDSPTIKGTIANLAKAELDTSALTIKAVIGTNDSPEKVIAEGTVSPSGVFNIKLPGLSVLDSDLVKTPTNSTTYLWPCKEVVNTPKEYDGARLSLKLYSNGQPVEEGYIFYGSKDYQVSYVFVDRDVVYKADCAIEDKTLNVNEEHKKGWNTVIATISSDEKQIEVFSGVPDSSYKWLIFCSPNCSEPDPDPASALGDSPTLTGKIANLAKAELDTSALTIKAVIYGEKVIAQGTVSSSGVFSIKLPGLSELANDLLKFANDPVPIGTTCTGVVAKPDVYKAAQTYLKLYSKGQPVEADVPLFYTSNKDQNAFSYPFVGYIFVDRDVVTQADCPLEDSTLKIDTEYIKGWNIFIKAISSDGKRLEIYSAVPDSSYKWLIFICSPDCPKPIPE